MAEILEFPKKRDNLRQFFESEREYQEYLKAEKELRKKPLGPFLTLKDLWYILIGRY